MMHFKVQLFSFLSFLIVESGLCGRLAVARSAEAARPSADAKTPPPGAPSFLGKPLSYWVSQAAGTERAESLDRIVDALSQTVGRAGVAHPVIHKGKLYLRHDDLLCCYDVRAYD